MATEQRTQPELLCIEAAEYHARTDAVSASMMKVFAGSARGEGRRMYHARYIAKTHPEKQRDIMDMGSLMHAAILEPHTLEETYVPYPREILGGSTKGPNTAKNTKASKQFAEEVREAGRTPVMPDDYEQIQTVVQCVKASKAARLIYAGGALIEHSIIWTDEDSGLLCKMRSDILIECADVVHTFDLKWTATAAPWLFRSTAKTLRYWIPDSHYRAGIQAHFNKPAKFHFVAIENEWPHRVGVHYFDQNTQVDADAKRRSILYDIRTCLETGDWSDPWEAKPNPLNLRDKEMWYGDGDE